MKVIGGGHNANGFTCGFILALSLADRARCHAFSTLASLTLGACIAAASAKIKVCHCVDAYFGFARALFAFYLASRARNNTLTSDTNSTKLALGSAIPTSEWIGLQIPTTHFWALSQTSTT